MAIVIILILFGVAVFALGRDSTFSLRREGYHAAYSGLIIVVLLEVIWQYILHIPAQDGADYARQLFLAKGALETVLLIWFIGMYGYLLLFALFRVVVPSLTLGDVTRPRLWWLFPACYALGHLLLSLYKPLWAIG